MMSVPTPFSLFPNSRALSHSVAFIPDDIGVVDNPVADGIGLNWVIQILVHPGISN